MTGKNPNRLFTMSTVVDGKRVTGSGTSILRAKRATAKKALALLNNSSTSDPSGDTLQATTDNIGKYFLHIGCSGPVVGSLTVSYYSTTGPEHPIYRTMRTV